MCGSSFSTTHSLRSFAGLPLSTWLRNNRLGALAALAFTLVTVSVALVFFYAPVDADGLNQGSLPVGPLVGMARGPARSLSRAVSLLRGVLHAALLGSSRTPAVESQRRLRPLRRRARAGEHPRDPPVRTLHPSRGFRQGRSQHGRVAVLHVLRLACGDARPRRDALPRRARR